MQHARDRIRELTGRRWLLLRPEAIVQDMNAFLREWAAYFRYGHSAQRLCAEVIITPARRRGCGGASC